MRRGWRVTVGSTGLGAASYLWLPDDSASPPSPNALPLQASGARAVDVVVVPFASWYDAGMGGSGVCRAVLTRLSSWFDILEHGCRDRVLAGCTDLAGAKLARFWTGRCQEPFRMPRADANVPRQDLLLYIAGEVIQVFWLTEEDSHGERSPLQGARFGSLPANAVRCPARPVGFLDPRRAWHGVRRTSRS